MHRFLIFALFAVWLAALPVQASEVVVLTEKPVAEFTLPDGSVLKNAFVWRRTSEGLMIVHDEGQYFLNFSLLPADWKAAYLGAAAEPVPEKDAVQDVPQDDRYGLGPTLAKVPLLSTEGRKFLLREDADTGARDTALALALLQSLLSNNRDEAHRVFLVIEELGLDIPSVGRDILFKECSVCDGNGTISRECAACGGTGRCPKCNGTGQRKSGLADTTVYCTTCRGKGKCLECQGTGQLVSRCRACGGRGTRLNSLYCEIRRDQLALKANADAAGAQGVIIVRADPERFRRTIGELPGLDAGARRFYLSDAYDGSMDTNLLGACIIHSLLKDRHEDAERFFLMAEAFFPKQETLKLDTYLKPCDACEASGVIERKCGSCGGTGKCARCGGDGRRDSEFKGRGSLGSKDISKGKSKKDEEKSTIHCTTCRGTGKCPACNGTGTKKVRCGKCNGTGRLFEKERAKIKLHILTDALNDFYKRQS